LSETKTTGESLTKGLNNTANTKQGMGGPNGKRLTRIAIGVFE